MLDLLPPTRTGDPAAAALDRELPRYLQEGTTPNGVFAAKLMWGYFADLLARLGTTPDGSAVEALAARFGAPSWVHVTRADKVAQAVSLWRALQTRAWSAAEPPQAHPVYDAHGHPPPARPAARAGCRVAPPGSTPQGIQPATSSSTSASPLTTRLP